MKKFFVIASVTCLFAVGSCKKADICNPAPQFNIDLYIQNVEAAMGNVSGYQFAVNRDGNLYYSMASGNSIYPSDPGGPVAMTANTRMNVASVSKFIGTIALLQVLGANNISIDEPIRPYLPIGWRSQVHPDHFDAGSAYKISFKNMLRMETALAFAGSTWSPGIMTTAQEMLDALKLPAAPNRWGVYQNGNFTLIRVLIGQIVYNLNETAPDYNLQTANKYFDYIRQNIFDKLNLSPPMTVAAINNYYSGNFTRGHQFPFNINFRDAANQVGWPATSDPEDNGGSGGLVLSAIDLAKVLAFFMHGANGVITNANQRKLILDNELGLIESTTGANGRYKSKGGTRGPEDPPNNRALRSRVMIYPNGVEVVLLSNCNITTMGTILRDAFDAAWVSPC